MSVYLEADMKDAKSVEMMGKTMAALLADKMEMMKAGQSVAHLADK